MTTIRFSHGLNVLLVAGSILLARTPSAQTRPADPVLAFPEPGLDDPAAYQGYQTRFFRDAGGNTVQVYLDARTGRAVTVMANAVNESGGFTVRDGGGKPLRLEWGSARAVVSRSGSRRSIEYQLTANAPQIQISWIVLGSMRVERDLVYSGHHLKPFGFPAFSLRELDEMIANLQRLEPAERARHLRLLNAGGVPELQRRLQPTLTSVASGTRRAVVATQAALDDRTHLQLELIVDPREATIVTAGDRKSTRLNS